MNEMVEEIIEYYNITLKVLESNKDSKDIAYKYFQDGKIVACTDILNIIKKYDPSCKDISLL